MTGIIKFTIKQFVEYFNINYYSEHDLEQHDLVEKLGLTVKLKIQRNATSMLRILDSKVKHIPV